MKTVTGRMGGKEIQIIFSKQEHLNHNRMKSTNLQLNKNLIYYAQSVFKLKRDTTYRVMGEIRVAVVTIKPGKRWKTKKKRRRQPVNRCPSTEVLFNEDKL